MPTPGPAITLSPSNPNQTLTTNSYAYSPVTTARLGKSPKLQTAAAAIYAPSPTHFHIQNTATISSPGTSPIDFGILLATPGYISNTGNITAGSPIGILGSTPGAYAVNYGNLTATAPGNHYTNDVASGIYIQPRGVAVNFHTINGAAGIQLAGGGYVYNYGNIFATYAGILLTHGGAVYNYAGNIDATVEAIRITKSTGYVYNYAGAAIAAAQTQTTGYPAAAIYLGAGGNIGNYGLITGFNGIVSNAQLNLVNAGAIVATNIGIDLPLTAANITNTNVIQGGNIAILLGAAGNLRNTSQITGGKTAILAYSNASIYNAGTIHGYTNAINFFTPNAGRLIQTPSARLIGTVSLNGAFLELAKGNATTGTISLASSQLLQVGQITIDTGATWDLAGTYLNGSEDILLNNGLIAESPADQIAFNGPLVGNGTIELSTQPLTIRNSAATTQHIAFTAINQSLTLTNARAFHATLENFTPTDTVALPNISLSSIESESFQHGILTLNQSSGPLTFTFASPKTFTSETFTAFTDNTGIAITLTHVPLSFVTPAATPAQPAEPFPTYTPATTQHPTPIPTATLSGWLRTPLLNHPTPPQPFITLHPK